jgi:hypothetical protein
VPSGNPDTVELVRVWKTDISFEFFENCFAFKLPHLGRNVFNANFFLVLVWLGFSEHWNVVEHKLINLVENLLISFPPFPLVFLQRKILQ